MSNVLSNLDNSTIKQSFYVNFILPKGGFEAAKIVLNMGLTNTLNMGPPLHKDYHLLMHRTRVILTQILNFFFMRASIASWSSSEKASK